MDNSRIDFTNTQVAFLLKNRGVIPHFYALTEHKEEGCSICGQALGALQHNKYLVADYETLQNERDRKNKRMTQQQYFDAFIAITEKMIQLTKVKNTDYAENDDAFANFKVIEILSHGRITTADGIWVRMTDKIKRISSLLSREAVGKDEKLTDTVFDLAVYSVILMIWLESQDKGWNKFKEQEKLDMRHTHTFDGNDCRVCQGPCVCERFSV